MKNKLTFNRIVFFLNMFLCTCMGAMVYENVIEHNYLWIIGDFIVLVMLYVSTYVYAKDIDKER